MQVRLQFARSYIPNAVRMLLVEVQKPHGQGMAHQLIREPDLKQKFGLTPGSDFSDVSR